jgi:hypothetical protein
MTDFYLIISCIEPSVSRNGPLYLNKQRVDLDVGKDDLSI